LWGNVGTLPQRDPGRGQGGVKARMVGFGGLFGAGFAPTTPVMVAGAWPRTACGAGAAATFCMGPWGPAPSWFGFGVTMVLFGLVPC